MWQDAKSLNAVANILFGLVLAAVVSSGIWWLINRPFFALDVVRVEAQGYQEQQTELRHVNALSIRDQALPHITGNFFTTNLDTVRLAFESVPWVRRASVQRVWPNKLLVVVEEHEVLGTWGSDGRLISVAGDVFTANLAEAEDDVQLLAFSGPAGSEKEVVAQYREFKTWFARISLEPEAVDYSGRYAWSVKLNNGMRVDLGKEQEADGLKKRVNQLIKVYPQLVTRLQGSIVSVDMRYPNGLALKSSSDTFGLSAKKVN